MTPGPDTDGPLEQSAVHFLALEGGGGKGVAFLGAIQALEELGVLTHVSSGAPASSRPAPPTWLPGVVDTSRMLSPAGLIRGIAGASAGAITALLLSCGYDAAEIGSIMTSFDFDSFFEPPTPRRVPRVGTHLVPGDPLGAVDVPVEQGPPADDLVGLLGDHALAVARDALVRSLPLARRDEPDRRRQDTAGDLAEAFARRIIEQLADQWLDGVPALVRQIARDTGHPLPAAGDTLLAGFRRFLEFLPADMGFFAGYRARAFFAELMAAKMPPLNGQPNYHATFAEHHACFEVELAVTGTNLESGKSGIFSHLTTPHFPVADAVRISMSLPLAYKPYVIRPEHYHPIDLPPWVDGVWIDGGYLNNLPLHVFDSRGGVRHTLGVRLEIDAPPQPVSGLGAFLGRWPLAFGFMGAGEAHVGPGTANDPQTIVLDTSGLDLLRFSYPPAVVDAVSRGTSQQVREYFRR